MRTDLVWQRLTTPPAEPCDCLVRGQGVGWRTGRNYACWYWDGSSWLNEDGTELFWIYDGWWRDVDDEMNFLGELADAEWTRLP